ncbi:hypothetical protein CGZ94_04925 [Enemella evansiae]|uniref:Uncharacterized protein n=1 Tax=Enemella evansiae TaxID=2016499 RepID=A0A255GNZ0_9ACTN|nr:hypothetical protein [Enemella evansiae]OYO16286.1 hypothetical protein CGZ94_04925 [Enemella evansiae]
MFITETAELKGRAIEAIDAAELDQVAVTDDLAQLGTLIATGNAVVIIMPPAIRWDTWTSAALTWSLYIAAGPDPIHALGPLNALLDALAGPLELTEGEPVTLATNQGRSVAGYRLTTTATFLTQ